MCNEKVVAPESFRVVWSSPDAKNIWEPRIARISNAIRDVELLTVEQKVRNGAIRLVPTAGLPEVSKSLYQRGLHVIPLSQSGNVPESYRNSASPGTGLFRCLVLRQASHIYGTNDSDIGTLLGYPECCVKFFTKNWSSENYDVSNLQLLGTPVYNRNLVIYRQLGVRNVFHLPCSVNCYHSSVVAAGISNTLRNNGYNPEFLWMHEILNWPVRVSSLNGIIETTNPVFKIVSTTTCPDFEFLLEGQYPEHGATGLEFPFKETKARPFLNGFSSRASMIAAHKELVTALGNILTTAPGEAKLVLDLGCGDGELLRNIVYHYPNYIPAGVEVDRGTYELAASKLRTVFNTCITKFPASSLLSFVTIVAAERVKEGFDLKRLNSKYVLLYSYGDAELEVGSKKILYASRESSTRWVIYENF